MGVIRRWGRGGLIAAAVVLSAVILLRGSDDAVADQPLPPGRWSDAERGAWAFRTDGFGGLSAGPLDTHAVPWKLVAAALVLDARRHDPAVPLAAASLRPILSRYGFLYPAAVGNWPGGLPEPGASPLPLGMTHGVLSPVRGLPVAIANLGCAACHAGATYDATGRAMPERAWLGMPNSSLNLEGYTVAVYDALRRAQADRPGLLRATAAMFPDMGARERLALEWLVLPRVAKRIDALAGAGRPLPFPNGLPGSTNGVAALKMALGVPLRDGGAGEVGFVSIPDLGYRDWRRSLLVDGAYAVPGDAPDRPSRAGDRTPAHRISQAAITTFFTVPSMGVHPDRSGGSIAAARDTLAFLSGTRAQPFPGPVDRAAATAGGRVYAAHCAACHGRYDAGLPPRLVAFPNWIGDVGTDPLRAEVFGDALVDAVRASPYRDRIAPRRSGGYAAPPLGGIWASAPYLHNGSVPTIAALLDPALRPVRFRTGGHALDFVALGLRIDADGGYPAGVRPWSQPGWIDTRRPGLANGGHVYGAALSATEKRQLIEYLKLL
ncbi:c-type cytochrome [Sphingomonas silueang]|uniref:c-type cytochrome n=1 Tax=Sphingomonas silueang TaxID=3156617 RepID=UPI0032B57EF9